MAALTGVPRGKYRNEMKVDGYNKTITLAVEITVSDDGMHADFTGTSPLSEFGINVPIVYAQAYFTYGMLVALAPELPNNYASLLPFTVSAPTGVILNGQDPDPVAVRHVIGHFVTDLCLGALAPVLLRRHSCRRCRRTVELPGQRPHRRPFRTAPADRNADVQQRWRWRSTDTRRPDRNGVSVRRHDDERRGHRTDRASRRVAQGDPRGQRR